MFSYSSNYVRTYIFTDRERRVISAFLRGKIPINDAALEQIRSRVKSFNELSGDLELYLRLREATSTASTKPSLDR
jgi:hypothetical protein